MEEFTQTLKHMEQKREGFPAAILIYKTFLVLENTES